MKKILLIVCMVIFAFFGVAVADQTVTFQWDDGNSPSPDGYRLFIRDQGASYDYSTPIWQGPENTYSATLADGNYAAVVRAYSGSIESGDSNEVVFTVEPQPPAMVVPGRPKQLIINFE